MVPPCAATISRAPRERGHRSRRVVTAAQGAGARLIACTMTMDLLGIAASELIDGVELGGVAPFLGEAAQSGTTLFI